MEKMTIEQKIEAKKEKMIADRVPLCFGDKDISAFLAQMYAEGIRIGKLIGRIDTYRQCGRIVAAHNAEAELSKTLGEGEKH